MTRIILLLLLTCWVFESPAQSRNTTVYEYDNLNRLVHVSYQDREVHYSYDELGNRIGMLVVGSSLKGDVNEDGMVTYNDVAALICIILNQDMADVYNSDAADVNKDGLITIADVTALVNIILGKVPLSSMEKRQVINLSGDEEVSGQ